MNLRSLIGDKLNPIGWLKDVFFGGIGAVVLAILMEYFGLLKGQPGVVDLLRAWGYIFPLALVAIVGVFVFLGQILDMLRDGIRSLAESSRDGAIAQNRMAVAMQHIAEKDDRQLQELQTMSTYNARQNKRMHHQMRRSENYLKAIAAKMKVEPQPIETVEEDDL